MRNTLGATRQIEEGERSLAGNNKTGFFRSAFTVRKSCPPIPVAFTVNAEQNALQQPKSRIDHKDEIQGSRFRCHRRRQLARQRRTIDVITLTESYGGFSDQTVVAICETGRTNIGRFGICVCASVTATSFSLPFVELIAVGQTDAC